MFYPLLFLVCDKNHHIAKGKGNWVPHEITLGSFSLKYFGNVALGHGPRPAPVYTWGVVKPVFLAKVETGFGTVSSPSFSLGF